MKVAPRDIDKFLTKPDPAARAILVYGADAGLVRERAVQLARGVCPDLDDPFRVARLTGAQIADDPARLSDEAAAIAMIGGRRVIRIDGVGDVHTKHFKAFLDHPVGDALIVLEGGDLAARSSLRSAFEEAAAGAAIACYADDDAALERLVRAMLTEAGLRIGDEAREMLVARLGGDRGLSRREIEKLITYVGADGAVVTEADIEAVVGDTAASGIDDVVYAAAGGDHAALDRALARAFQEGDPPIAILRVTQKHFQKLQFAQSSGGDARMLAKRLGIFFKREAAFAGQLQRWPLGRITTALDLLTEAELDCKSTGAPDAAICRHTLLRLATAARAGRR